MFVGIPSDLSGGVKAFPRDCASLPFFFLPGIPLDAQWPSAVKQFMKKFGMNYHVAIGAFNIVEYFGGAGIPSTFVINRSGKIVARISALRRRRPSKAKSHRSFEKWWRNRLLPTPPESPRRRQLLRAGPHERGSACGQGLLN
jgi:antitoxin (DNA-binding transcriptional repressor) of toxin-antitoxin stability system